MLIFALPFEYYFGGREQSLYTSLKLQILLLIATWTCMKLVESRESGGTAWKELRVLLPGLLLLATVAFVLSQLLAAAFASELRANAVRAAAKAGIGALMSVITADLSSRPKLRTSETEIAIFNPLFALSLSGTCAALLGLGELAGIRGIESIVHVFQPSRYFLANRLRFLSTMEYPNTAGSFLSVSLCATLALTIFQRTSPRRPGSEWVWLAMVTAQGFALAFTYSRGALGATIIAVVAATWAVRDRVLEGRGGIAVATCLAVLLAGVTVLYPAREKAAALGPPAAQRVARFGLEADQEIEYLLPNHACSEVITVENDSSYHWRRGAYGIAYRWHSLSTNQNSPLLIGTEFLDDVAPAQKVQASVSLSTPPQEGEYLLTWFVFHRNDDIRELKDSYSPGILCIVDAASPDEGKAPSVKARRYLDAIREERRNLNMTIVPGRLELWSAAFRMFWKRPFLGMGPDSFRILKWRYMDTPKGDETILANSLYLELLSGSGLLGLASFLWLAWEFGRSVTARFSSKRSPSERITGCLGIAYLAGLLSHGLVDYFLKFTPTFLLFWLMLGMLCARQREAAQRDNADRI
jgi:O-antigen ligase